jgi:hypothetical protein
VDPVITSAIIGLAGVIGGYAIQNYFSRKADRELERFKLKREKYEDLLKQIAIEMHLVKTKARVSHCLLLTRARLKTKFDIIL